MGLALCTVYAEENFLRAETGYGTLAVFGRRYEKSANRKNPFRSFFSKRKGRGNGFIVLQSGPTVFTEFIKLVCRANNRAGRLKTTNKKSFKYVQMKKSLSCLRVYGFL